MDTNDSENALRSAPGPAIRQIFLRLKFASLLLPVAFCFLAAANSVAAQEGEQGQQQQEPAAREIAPPPLKILAKDERQQLDGENGVSERTKLALGLMEARLRKAEALDGQNQFPEMYTELGRLQALMDYTLNFLNRNDNGSRKVLNNFKRFEIGIRAFAPRLEVVRRNLPLRYEFYVRGLIRTIRDLRSKAVEAFFDNTVVPNDRKR